MATDNTSATFELRLEDGTSGPAASAANALKSLRSQIDADSKALAGMQRAMRNLQGGTVVNVAQFRALKKSIDEKKASIAQAQSAYLSLGGSFTRTSSSGKAMRSMLEQLTEQAKMAPGPLGQLVSKLGGLRGMVMGGVIVVGIMAIVTALAALVSGTIAAGAALAKYGVAQADARRNELLRFEGLTKIRSIYGWVAGKASDLQASVDQVSASSALGRDELVKYTEQLYRMGLRGQNLTDALEGMTIKAVTQGEAQATLFANMAAGAALAGGSVRKLADDVKARLGELAARKMLSLDVQIMKMKEHFGVLFRDIKVEGFLKALQSITSLFSQSTVSGRALKSMLEIMLQPLIDGFNFVAPLARRFFQGMIIGLQVIQMAVLSVAIWFKKTFGSNLIGSLDLMKVALYAGIFAVGTLVGLFSLLALSVGLIVAPFAAAAGTIYVFVRALMDAYNFWTGLDWSSLGTSIAQGIVSGIKKGSSWVIDAVKNLGKGAWKAFKAALGIASPSKEFARLGVEIPRGVQTGIEKGSAGANSAASSIVSIPDAPLDSGKKRSGGNPVSVTIENISITSNAMSLEGLEDDITRTIERVFERVAVQMGARIPGGA